MIRYRPVTLGPDRSPVAALLALAAAAVTLGCSLQIADGFYEPGALLALTGALVLTVVGVLMMPKRDVVGHGGWPVRVVLTAGIALQLAVLYTASPGMYIEPDANLWLFAAGVVVEGALVVLGVSGLRQAARWWFPAVLAVNLALGVWMLKASPNPRIDVVEVHQSALRALGRGRNPYRVTFRNIYGQNSGFYNPEAVAGDRVLFGYPYPPMSLLAGGAGAADFQGLPLRGACGSCGCRRAHRLCRGLTRRAARGRDPVDDSTRVLRAGAGLDRTDRRVDARRDDMGDDSTAGLVAMDRGTDGRDQAIPRPRGAALVEVRMVSARWGDAVRGSSGRGSRNRDTAVLVVESYGRSSTRSSCCKPRNHFVSTRSASSAGPRVRGGARARSSGPSGQRSSRWLWF